MNISFPTLAISVFILWLFAKGQAATYWKDASSIGWDLSITSLLPFISGGEIQVDTSGESSGGSGDLLGGATGLLGGGSSSSLLSGGDAGLISEAAPLLLA